jgi:hypothetical protein
MLHSIYSFDLKAPGGKQERTGTASIERRTGNKPFSFKPLEILINSKPHLTNKKATQHISLGLSDLRTPANSLLTRPHRSFTPFPFSKARMAGPPTVHLRNPTQVSRFRCFSFGSVARVDHPAAKSNRPARRFRFAAPEVSQLNSSPSNSVPNARFKRQYLGSGESKEIDRTEINLSRPSIPFAFKPLVGNENKAATNQDGGKKPSTHSELVRQEVRPLLRRFSFAPLVISGHIPESHTTKDLSPRSKASDGAHGEDVQATAAMLGEVSFAT